jgi:pimeloyl-ACP methyl ester carboxylesterase
LSIGGAIVQQLLLDFADRFEAGILIGTGARLKVLPAIFEAIENDYTGFVEMACKLAASENTDAHVSQPMRDDLIKCKPEVTYGDFQACNEFNVIERLHEISLPVLIISAEKTAYQTRPEHIFMMRATSHRWKSPRRSTRRFLSF